MNSVVIIVRRGRMEAQRHVGEREYRLMAPAQGEFLERIVRELNEEIDKKLKQPGPPIPKI